MTSPSGFTSFGLLLFVAGMGIPLMAGLNAQLGMRLGSPVAALTILFGVGLFASVVVLAMVGTPSWSSVIMAPPFLLLAGLLVVFYVLSITVAAPHIGLGNAIFLVLLGQLVSAAVIDHFGLLGGAPTPVDLRRALGIVVMAAGVFLATKR